jgi:hypothetical protein
VWHDEDQPGSAAQRPPLDQFGQVIDVSLSQRRDLASARRFFETATMDHGLGFSSCPASRTWASELPTHESETPTNRTSPAQARSGLALTARGRVGARGRPRG